VEPFSLRVGHKRDLTPLGIGKRDGLKAVRHCSTDLFSGEIRAQHAVGIRKTAADIATEARAARYKLRKDFQCGSHGQCPLRNPRGHEGFRKDGTF
jgi:hypothetical protein